MGSQRPLFSCSDHLIRKALGPHCLTCLTRGFTSLEKVLRFLGKEKNPQTYYCNNNSLVLEGVFYFNSSIMKNSGNRTTLPSTKLNLFFRAKGQSLHCVVCDGIGKHCASFCSMDCTQTPVSHLEAIINATKVSSTGAASLSYCTDQNPSQNTCRIQVKFNYDFSFSTCFVFSTF